MSNEYDYIVDDRLDRLEHAPSGVGGWLLFYALFPTAFGGIAFPIWSLLTGNGIEVPVNVAWEALLLILNAIGFFLIFFVRRPLTRYFHIGLNATIAIQYLAVGILDSNMRVVFAGLLVFAIWSGYWIRSKRVRETYLFNV